MSAAASAAAWAYAIERSVDAIAGGPAPLPGGRLVGTVPLGRFDRRPAPPFHERIGSGLDTRQFVDLSSLAEDALITPNDRFFIRTSAPEAASSRVWALQVGGRVARPESLTLQSLESLVRSAGTHLIECAGNSDPANFGLMSAARWDGIPIAALLDRLRPQTGAWRVQVTGVDDEASPSRTSQPGASWVFRREDLERTGAFLATAMNGAALPADHGRPMRLVVPGWYGCTCIKWVSRIDLVPDDAPATSQMIEFARRTHQDGRPALARDYEPPAIELAATPIRVEQWIVNGGVVYRVVGVMWGGEKPTNALLIRFKHNEPLVRVSDCPMPASTTTWSLWSHMWKPAEPGRYRIVLQAGDPAVKARRLEMFFYTREVEIQDV